MPELLFWRFWQSFGASPGLAVGAGVVGDIYKLEERGTAMGIFFSVRSFAPQFEKLFKASDSNQINFFFWLSGNPARARFGSSDRRSVERERSLRFFKKVIKNGLNI